jgi:hypothetical protein
MSQETIAKYVLGDARTLELLENIAKKIISKKPLSYDAFLKESAVLEAITRLFPMNCKGSTSQNIKLFVYVVVSSIYREDPTVNVTPLVESVNLFQGARGKSLVGERTYERIKGFKGCLEAFCEGYV